MLDYRNLEKLNFNNFRGVYFMFNRGELKTCAKSKLKGKWGVMVGIFFIYSIIMIGTQFLEEWNVLTFIPMLILTGPIALSISKISLNVSKGGETPKISQLLYGFKYFIKAIGVYLISIVAGFAITLSALLPEMPGVLLIIILIVPVTIVTLMFSQIIYILADNPEIGVIDAAKESCRLTKGYKGNIFVLQLSFIGLVLLSILTMGILLLWVMPYMQVTFSELYLYLKEQKLEVVAE